MKNTSLVHNIVLPLHSSNSYSIILIIPCVYICVRFPFNGFYFLVIVCISLRVCVCTYVWVNKKHTFEKKTRKKSNQSFFTTYILSIESKK